MSDLQNKKAELNKKKEEYRKTVEEQGKQLLLDACRPIFEKYPGLNWVSLKAYTCYFNDGDTCYHSVYSDSYSLQFSHDKIGGSTFDDMYEYDVEKKEYVAEFDFLNEFAEVLSEFDSEDFIIMFGDHVEVTIYSDHIDVEDYTDHD